MLFTRFIVVHRSSKMKLSFVLWYSVCICYAIALPRPQWDSPLEYRDEDGIQYYGGYDARRLRPVGPYIYAAAIYHGSNSHNSNQDQPNPEDEERPSRMVRTGQYFVNPEIQYRYYDNENYFRKLHQFHHHHNHHDQHNKRPVIFEYNNYNRPTFEYYTPSQDVLYRNYVDDETVRGSYHYYHIHDMPIRPEYSASDFSPYYFYHYFQGHHPFMHLLYPEPKPSIEEEKESSAFIDTKQDEDGNTKTLDEDYNQGENSDVEERIKKDSSIDKRVDSEKSDSTSTNMKANNKQSKDLDLEDIDDDKDQDLTLKNMRIDNKDKAVLLNVKIENRQNDDSTSEDDDSDAEFDFFSVNIFNKQNDDLTVEKDDYEEKVDSRIVTVDNKQNNDSSLEDDGNDEEVDSRREKNNL